MMIEIKKSSILCGIIFLQVFASFAGQLDLSYGPNGTGYSIFKVGRKNNLLSAALLPDDRLIGVGTVTVQRTVSGVSRITSSGSLDSTFNTVGYVQFLPTADSQFNAVALQPDGKIVAAGCLLSNVCNFLVARYDEDGILDTTFGGLGYVSTVIDNASTVNAVVIQPDGYIVAGGYSISEFGHFTLARYAPDGSRDDFFGNDGIVITPIGSGSSIIEALALQADGKIVAAGKSFDGTQDAITIARYNTDGTPDITFAGSGVVVVPVGSLSMAYDLVIQQDGKIVVGGYTTSDDIHRDFALVRLNNDGSLDTDFNQTGIVVTPLDYSSEIHSLLLQPDGKIVAGGYIFGLVTTNFAMVRYLTDGSVDMNFGQDGLSSTSIFTNSSINSLSMQSDGKIIAAGVSNSTAAIARFTS